MLIDKQNLFADAQAVTATALSTNVIDHNHIQNALKDIGTGECLYLVITCSESAAAAGAATVTFTLESDSDSGLVTSPTVHFSTGAIGKAALTAGMAPMVFCLPRQNTYERYLGVRFTVATGPLTAGKFSVALVGNAPSFKPYAKSYNVF